MLRLLMLLALLQLWPLAVSPPEAQATAVHITFTAPSHTQAPRLQEVCYYKPGAGMIRSGTYRRFGAGCGTVDLNIPLGPMTVYSYARLDSGATPRYFVLKGKAEVQPGERRTFGFTLMPGPYTIYVSAKGKGWSCASNAVPYRVP
jgi:hypothetical protein